MTRAVAGTDTAGPSWLPTLLAVAGRLLLFAVVIAAIGSLWVALALGGRSPKWVEAMILMAAVPFTAYWLLGWRLRFHASYRRLLLVTSVLLVLPALVLLFSMKPWPRTPMQRQKKSCDVTTSGAAGRARCSRNRAGGAWSASVCLLFSVAISGCADERISEVTLDQLVGAPATFDGEQVRTRGIVQALDDPEHYWIETSPRNRVAVRPRSAVVDRVGESVVVVGRFTWDPERGRRLELQSVLPADEP